MQDPDERPIVSSSFNIVVGLLTGLLVVFVASFLLFAIACIWSAIRWII